MALVPAKGASKPLTSMSMSDDSAASRGRQVMNEELVYTRKQMDDLMAVALADKKRIREFEAAITDIKAAYKSRMDGWVLLDFIEQRLMKLEASAASRG